MIQVVSLSPAIDVTYELTNVSLGEVHRVQAVHKIAGGKGVNVARVIHSGGHRVKIVLPLGGSSGQWMREKLEQLGIEAVVVPVHEETRSCVAVVAQDTTVLNEPAANLTDREFENFLAALAPHVKLSILSGSLPASITSLQLNRLIETLRKTSEIMVVDTSGPALVMAAEAKCDLLKPNREEALGATNTTNVAEAIENLLGKGARAVLLSDGSRGAIFARPKGNITAAIEPLAGNATGAGDAMVALAAISLHEGQSDSELLRYAIAAGTLAVLQPVAGTIDWKRLEEFALMVENVEV